ncbi:hypothetical protein M758_11G088600 [Ceratodon purpureus]|uniref:Uncharacterized protein n=1 Tax=Ceratodon purpureus TaxID=3225 RepID=A0A8T0GGR0_CERPU|nr:hypothetical protein KC19_11G091600 [Ceratodon purpureus]KAG0601161.1 hypothetical protein M758_11G088600 [Ceratodon purpureus]
MAALVLYGTLRLHDRRISQGTDVKSSLRSRRGLSRVRLGWHGALENASGRCFLRITSSRVGQIQGKGLQVVAVKEGGRSEVEEERDGVGFGAVKGVANAVLEAVSAVQKPAMVALLFCLLVSQGPEMAVAASGGRVGGNSFRSGQTRSAPSRPSPAPRQSYSRPSAPIYSAPPIQTYHNEYITIPLTAPAPNHYMGPATGFGLGSSSLFFIAFCMGCASMIAVNGFLSEKTFGGSLRAGAQTSTVLKLQVGLLGLARTLQQDLDRIADDADTTTTKGLHYILTESCLSLLRHPDFCMSGLCSSFVKRNETDTEDQFNQLSLEERGKFDEETFINVNSIRKRMVAASKGNNRFSNEFIVVTILVAVEGEHKLPAISSSEDLQKALQKLGSLSESSIQAVEVLWTPQDENDTLTERELLRKYPLLRSL